MGDDLYDWALGRACVMLWSVRPIGLKEHLMTVAARNVDVECHLLSGWCCVWLVSAVHALCSGHGVVEYVPRQPRGGPLWVDSGIIPQPRCDEGHDC